MIWMEGFDGPGTIAALDTKLAFDNTDIMSLVSALTGSGSALKQTATSTTNYYFYINFPTPPSPLWFHFKIKIEKGTTSADIPALMYLTMSGNYQGYLKFNTSGNSITVHQANGISAGSFTVPYDTVFSLRGYITPADAGHVKIWKDGAVVIDVDGDFKNAGSAATIDTVRFQLADYTGATAYTNCTIDHLVFSDSEIPDCKITTYRPVADGNYTQFTPSTGSDHYALVDETTLDTGDYNGSSTSGHIDTFKFTEPSLTGEILGAGLEFYVNKSDAGARTIRPIVRQGGTDYTGSADLALTEAETIASQYYEVNPATSADFTVAELTGASRTEFGLKIQS